MPQAATAVTDVGISYPSPGVVLTVHHCIKLNIQEKIYKMLTNLIQSEKHSSYSSATEIGSKYCVNI